MVRSRLGLGARLAAAAALGATWNAGAPGIALSPLVLLCYSRAETRGRAMATALAYYLGAAAPALVPAFGTGYGDLSGGELVVIAVGSAGLASSVWAGLWTSELHVPSLRASARMLGVLVVTALPGFGVLGVASPLTAAGLWLHGFGWAGLVLHAVTLATLRAPVLLVMVAASLLLGGEREVAAQGVGRASHMLALETHLDVPQAVHDYLGQYKTALNALRVVRPDASIVVLPEGVGGLWTNAMRTVWAERRAPAQTLILGATLFRYDADGTEHHEAAAVALLPDGQEHVMRQRVPLPGVLWRPWERGGYRAHWFDAGIVELEGERLAVLLCYEQLLVFPVLVSVAGGADTLVGLANVRAFEGARVARWQGAVLRAWAALFGLRWVAAVNS